MAEGLKYVTESNASRNRFVVNWGSIIEKYDKEFPDADVLDLDNFSIVHDRGELKSDGFSSKPFGSCRLPADRKRRTGHDTSSEGEGYDDLALSLYAESVLSCTLDTPWSQGRNQLLSSPEDIERELKVHSMITAADPSDGETISSSISNESFDEYDGMLISSDDLEECTDSQSSAASGQPSFDQSNDIRSIKPTAAKSTETYRADRDTGVKKALNFSSGISPIQLSESESGEDNQFLSLGESPVTKSVQNRTTVDREKIRLTLNRHSPIRLERKHVSAKTRVTGVVPPRQNNATENSAEGRFSDVLQSGVGENSSTPVGFSRIVPDRPVPVPVLVTPRAQPSRPLISVIQDLAGPSSSGYSAQNKERVIPRRSNFINRNDDRYDELDGRVPYDHFPERTITAHQSVPPNLILSVASSNDVPFSASNMQLFQLVPIGGQQSIGLNSVEQRRTAYSGPNAGFDLDRSNHRELLPNNNPAQSSTSSQFPRRNDASNDGVRQDFAPRITPASPLPVPIDSSRSPAEDRHDSTHNSTQPSQSGRQASNDLLVDVDMRTDQTSKKGCGDKILDRVCGKLPGHLNDRLDLQSPSSSRSFPIPRSDEQEMTNIKKKECLQMMSLGAPLEEHSKQPEQVSSPQHLEKSKSRLEMASESVTKNSETFKSPSWKVPTRPQTPKSSSVTPTRYSTEELVNIFQSPLPFRFGSPAVNIRPSPKQRSVKKELSAVFQSEPPKLIHISSPLLDRHELKAAVRDPWKICEKELTNRPNKVTVGDGYNHKPASSNNDHKELKVETKRLWVVDPNKKSVDFGTRLKSKGQSRIVRDAFDDVDGMKRSPQHCKVLGTATMARSPVKKDSFGLGLASPIDCQKSPYVMKSPGRKHSLSSNAKSRRIELTTQKLEDWKCLKPSRETPGLDILQSSRIQDTLSACRLGSDLAGGSSSRKNPLDNVTKQGLFRSPLQGKRLVRPQRTSESDKINRKQTLQGKPSPRNRKIQDDLQSLVRLGMSHANPGVPEVDDSDAAFKSPPNDDNTGRKSENMMDRKLSQGEVVLSGKAVVAEASLPKELGPDYQCFNPNLCSTVIGDTGLPESSSQSDVEDEQTRSEISSQEKVEKWLSGLESPEEVSIEFDDVGTIPEIIDDEIEGAGEVVCLANGGQVRQNLGDCVSSKTSVSGSSARKTFADILTELTAEAEKVKELSEAGDTRSDIVSLSSESTGLPRKVSQNCVGQAVADVNNSPKYQTSVKLVPLARNSPKNRTNVKHVGALPKSSEDNTQNRQALKTYVNEMSPKCCPKREECQLQTTPKSFASVERVQTPKGSVLSVDQNNNSVQSKRLIISKAGWGSKDCNVLGISDKSGGRNCTELTDTSAGSISRQEMLKVGNMKFDACRRLKSVRRDRKVQESKLPRKETQMLSGEDAKERIVHDLQSVTVPFGFRTTNVKEEYFEEFTKTKSGQDKLSRKRKFQYIVDSDSDMRSKLSKVERISGKSSQMQNEGVDCEETSWRKKLSRKPGILRKRKSNQVPLSDSSDSHILKVDQEKRSMKKGYTGAKMSALPRKEVTFMESVESSDEPDEGGLCHSFASPCAERCLGQGRCNKSFCFDCV